MATRSDIDRLLEHAGWARALARTLRPIGELFGVAEREGGTVASYAQRVARELGLPAPARRVPAPAAPAHFDEGG